VRDLLARGHTVYAIDPFGVGQNVDEQDPEQPRGSTKFFTTFNRTDDAERIYDIILALRHILPANPRTVNVTGFDRAGLWTLIAGALLEPRDTTCRWVIDTAGFSTAGDHDYLQRLPIPGILKAGGLPNAAALVAPHDLLLHNTGGVFDSTWAEAAYALYPGATLTLQEDRLRNDALVAFLG
jgi:hypothetical protein